MEPLLPHGLAGAREPELGPLRAGRGPVALYCFPYAGGSAATFRSWRLLAPPGLDVRPLERPGRGARLRERPIDDYVELVDLLAGELVADLGRRRGGGGRFALFGHSAGARFAFGVAARLLERGAPAPEHCFMAAASPPHAAPGERRRGHLDDAGLTEELRLLGGTCEEILSDPALLTHALPALRADLRSSEGAHVDRERSVSCPLTAFAARKDHLVDVEVVWEWERYTRGGFGRVSLQGGHFEVVREGTILRQIAGALSPRREGARP